MNNEENKTQEATKKTWETPEVIDFDVDKTQSGLSADVAEGWGYHPES
nr:hypothetical protein [uncultured Draconibacterium sp.]